MYEEEQLAVLMDTHQQKQWRSKTTRKAHKQRSSKQASNWAVATDNKPRLVLVFKGVDLP